MYSKLVLYLPGSKSQAFGPSPVRLLTDILVYTDTKLTPHSLLKLINHVKLSLAWNVKSRGFGSKIPWPWRHRHYKPSKRRELFTNQNGVTFPKVWMSGKAFGRTSSVVRWWLFCCKAWRQSTVTDHLTLWLLGVILLGFPAKALYAFLFHACLMPHLSYSRWQGMKITKFLIMYFSQPPVITFKTFTATKFSSVFQG